MSTLLCLTCVVAVMAYRGIKVPDPFTSKTTRNERFAQMSKQEQLIEQKKREIQAKLEEQKKKEADEALKKLHGVSGSGKAGASNKSSTSSISQNKSSQKPNSKSNLDSRWKKEPSHIDRNSSQQKTSGALNIFSNDGSFLDHFKKMSGVKEGKQRREDTVSSIIDTKSTFQATEIYTSDIRDRETTDRLERSERSRNSGAWESWQPQQVRGSSPYSPTRATSPVSDFSQPPPPPPPPPVQQPQPPQQMQIPTLPLTMAHCLPSVEHPPQLVQTPAPPLVSPEAPSALVLAPQPHSVSTVAASVSGTPNITPLGMAPSVPPPTVVLSHPPPVAPQYMQYPPPPPAPVQLRAVAPVQGPPPPQTLLVPPPPQLVSLQQQPPPTSAPMPHLVAAAQPPPTGVSSAAEPHVPSTEESMREVARMVAQCGDDIEEIIKIRNPDDQSVWFLRDKTDTAYMQYRCLVEKFKSEMEEEKKLESNELKVKTEIDNDNSRDSVKTEPPETDNRMSDCTVKQEQLDDENSCTSEGRKSGDESDSSRRRRKRKRSRWAPETEKVEIAPPVNQALTGSSPLLTKISRNHPALIQYAVQAFGTSNLSEEDWKKAEDHYKINLLYQDMLRKRQEIDQLARQGKFKYEYDSDEETDGGTWEHRLRMAEMEATQLWAEELTKKAEGKHHIGDFLPPDELERFMEKFQALKEGREPDLSDYKEYKLKEDNIGFQMLQKLGWTEGQGLGSDGSGIVDPVNKASTRPENRGLGLERPEDVSKGDDEYDAYRKRMMLAYRFRPNPLNNPRRPYY